MAYKYSNLRYSQCNRATYNTQITTDITYSTSTAT